MRLIESHPFDYVGYHGCHSRCDIRIFCDGTVYLVIATERDDNPGTSVTNMAEHLAWAVWRYLECPAAFTWVEHYKDRAKIGGRFTRKEKFDAVTFKRDARGRFYSPEWRSIDRCEIEQMVGCPIAD